MIHKLYPRDQIKNYLLLDVISLVFLFYMVLHSDSALGVPESLFLLLAFLISFYIGLWHRDRYLLAAVLSGMTTVTLLGMYVGPNLLLFGFIFADLLGRSKSKLHLGTGMAAIALMFVIVAWKRPDSLMIENKVYIPIMMVQMLVPVVVRIREKAKSLQGELDAANKQLEKYIQQEERQRIARDLHDTLGQTLTMIKLKSELAAKWVDQDPQQAKAELKDILSTSRTALKQVRELVSGMKFISLASELEQAGALLRTAGIQLELVEKAKAPLLSSVEETMLALCVREALTNIVKHSGAKRCTVRLETVSGHYGICIEDDGVGPGREAHGTGIPSMMERMRALNGTLTVDGSPGGGTVVTMKLPLHQHGKEEPDQ